MTRSGQRRRGGGGRRDGWWSARLCVRAVYGLAPSFPVSMSSAVLLKRSTQAFVAPPTEAWVQRLLKFSIPAGLVSRRWRCPVK